MQRIIIQTGDQSHTVWQPELDETFHSRHGAVNESLHVFIKAGLEKAAESRRTVRLFEAGFGTGLNALLTWHAVEALGISCVYHGIEAWPLEDEIVSALNYGSAAGIDGADMFRQLHACSWDSTSVLSHSFSLRKIHAALESWQPDSQYDLVYFDAFAPSRQPELWTAEIFSKLFACMSDGGILVTYSSKGDVRRALQQAGFRVEKLAGPAGKREMVRAFKNA